MIKNGADCLAQTLADNGIDTCFTNPGTTEMHLVAAFGRENRISSHLCLFEGVATGAADGYARMAGKPAATLLHLGPGLANGMANLHNARKASTPVINIVGDHAAYHKEHDAPLTADIEGMARPVSDLVETAIDADQIGAQAAAMLGTISGTEGRVATLIVPNDVAWSAATAQAATARPASIPAFNETALDAAAAALRKGAGSALLLGSPNMTARMAELAHAIGRVTGCEVFTETAVARARRGGDTPALQRIPFHVDLATEALSGLTTVVLAGARDPVAFFAYPDRPSRMLPENCRTVSLCAPLSDTEKVLEALAERLGAKPGRHDIKPLPIFDPSGPVTAETLGHAVARHLPENAIVVDEAITNGFFLFNLCGQSPAAHDWLSNRGGSIGYSMPVAIGAAVACPDRKVICITGDGSAFYTLQSLWTMARSGLDITVLILANRSYRILANETSKIGAGEPTPATEPLMSLVDPVPDWCRIAEGHGVSSERVESTEEMDAALKRAFTAKGPHLIEIVV